MTSREDEQGQSSLRLLPHQDAFLETFYSPSSKRVILLRGDVGLGKVITFAVLASQLLRKQPTARVLFLVPRALQQHFVETLRDAGGRPLLVDRYRFREMLDSTRGEEIWPKGIVAVLSREFAKQPDVRASLAETRWDLLIVDEVHSIGGTGARVLREIGASASRVVLATLSGLKHPDVFPSEEVTVVDWRRDNVVDYDGKPFDVAPPLVLHEVLFSLNADELGLRKTISALSEVLGSDSKTHDIRTTVLSRSLESSPAAIEGVLQRLNDQLNAQVDTDEFLGDLEELRFEKGLTAGWGPAVIEKAAEIVARGLQEIEKLTSDSKLDTLNGLLTELRDPDISSRRICILTQYLHTLYYLAAEIEDLGLSCRLLHGGMGPEDRQKSLAEFSTKGDILVASTSAVAEGPAWVTVTDLILYDIPGSMTALRQILGIFDRFGRGSQLDVHAFAPSGVPDDLVATPIALLRDLVAAQDSRS